MVDPLDLNKHIVVLQGPTNKSSTNKLVTQTETMELLANPVHYVSGNRLKTTNGTWKQVAQNNLI